MKRQRGRGRKPGGGGHHNNHGHQPNRTMESNGPEGKVRGPAALIYERYLQLARDASSSGDRVLAENFYQHADHYFRLVRAMQPAMPIQSERFPGELEDEGGEEAAPESEAAAEAGAAAEPTEAEHLAGQPQPAGDDKDGDFRRRRGRRNRFRAGENGELREGGGEPRQPREDRRERDGGRGPEEGFSGSPRPAFLRSE